MKNTFSFGLFLLFTAIVNLATAQSKPRTHESFNGGWTFHLGEMTGAEQPGFDDAAWRRLELPHDWSIELPFEKESPTGAGGGALRGGIGWYRKTFLLPTTAKG